MDSLRKRIFKVLDYSPGLSPLGKACVVFLIAMIVANVIAVILETKVEIFIEYAQFFIAFEFFSVLVFTVEYVLRLWTCVENPRYAAPIRGRLLYAVSFFGLIDFISIAPFYLPMILPIGLVMVRVLRITRIFRVFKLGRYSQSFTMMRDVFSRKKEDITIALFVLGIVLILASTGMYYAERDIQPDKFGSIPDAMWWTIVTLSTVGYGDVFPITGIGKVLGAIVAIAGIGFFALPAGIFATGYVEIAQERTNGNNGATNASTTNSESEEFICEHCGQVNRVTKRENGRT